ncbi:MAG: hypothetical protein ACLQIB_01045 [Isosphaeraceae bacterium]
MGDEARASRDCRVAPLPWLKLTLVPTGWRGSQRRVHRIEAAIPFLSKGYAVASINHRYSRQSPFPAQIEDCNAAIRWLRANRPSSSCTATGIIWCRSTRASCCTRP